MAADDEDRTQGRDPEDIGREFEVALRGRPDTIEAAVERIGRTAPERQVEPPPAA